MSGRPLNLLVVHHSASPRSTTFGEIRSWHLAKGWNDIGYHWVIEESGRVVRGRPIAEVGAHCLGRNHDSLGVCVAGNNTSPAEHWNGDQVFALRELVRAVRLLIPEIIVCGHRDAPGGKTPTECPGLDVLGLLDR